MKSKAKAALLLKAGITLSLLAYLAARLDWNELGRILANVQIDRYGAGVLVLAVAYSLNTVRWRAILAGQGLALRLRSALSIDLAALFFNSFLPGATGGDALRVYYASLLLRGEMTRLVAAVIADRLIGLTVLLTFGYFAYRYRPGIADHLGALQEALRWLPLALAAVFALCAGALFVPHGRMPAPLARALDRASSLPIVGRLLEFARNLRRRPQVLALAAAITVVAQVVGFLAAHLIARSIGIPLDYPETVLVMAITQTAISLPISVAGHGVREVVLIGVLSAMGAATGRPEIAIAFSVLLFSAQLFWSLIGGIWFAVRPRHRPPAQDA